MLKVLLLIFSCAKTAGPTDVSSARSLFDGKENCAEAIKDIMKDTDCKELRYAQLSDLEVMFQCHKPDVERDDFWDTMIFRVSPWSLRHNSKASAAKNKRLICLDEYVMIEAFHPKEMGVTTK